MEGVLVLDPNGYKTIWFDYCELQVKDGPSWTLPCDYMKPAGVVISVLPGNGSKRKEVSMSESLMESKRPCRLQQKLRLLLYKSYHSLLFVLLLSGRQTQPSVRPLPQFDVSPSRSPLVRRSQPVLPQSNNETESALRRLQSVWPPRHFLHSVFSTPWNGFSIKASFWFELIKKCLQLTEHNNKEGKIRTCGSLCLFQLMSCGSQRHCFV